MDGDLDVKKVIKFYLIKFSLMKL